MKTLSKKLFIFFLIGVLFPQSFASASDLTPLGADKAANHDGSIPAWEGGITEPPASYKAGGDHPNPFAEDKILFTITAADAEKYQDKLSAGHLALLKKYPDYKLNIYPTRRSASFPKYIYDAVDANSKTATLNEKGTSIEHAITGIPFPNPKNGLEAVWNHLLRFRGTAVMRDVDQAAVTTNGAYTIVHSTESFFFPYGLPNANLDQLKNVLSYFKQNIQSPARLAGTLVLVNETLDKAKQDRNAWVYNPGQRRVSRAPFINYDTPAPSSDGLRTFDQYDMFNGAPDLYDWQLIGKKEFYVPYNSYDFQSSKWKYSDILGKHFVNPDHARYELHRVWVVEGTLKKWKRHSFKKRVFYFDEDSWQILMADLYDSRDQLWRFSEAHPINYYEVPVLFTAGDIHYDLKVNRYLAMTLHNEAAPHNFFVKFDASNFTPESLRLEGTR